MEENNKSPVQPQIPVSQPIQEAGKRYARENANPAKSNQDGIYTGWKAAIAWREQNPVDSDTVEFAEWIKKEKCIHFEGFSSWWKPSNQGLIPYSSQQLYNSWLTSKEYELWKSQK